jgi:CheY-like chemotaxis protein
MPGINGPALFEKLRGSVPGLRALFVSGYTADQAIPEPYDARVSYLPKPFGAESLRQKVESLLGYH